MMMWKPWLRGAEPSAWTEIAASALSRLPMAARWVMHGPTPVLLDLVSLTVAPRLFRILASRLETSQVKAASE